MISSVKPIEIEKPGGSLDRAYQRLNSLIDALNKRTMPEETARKVNEQVETVNQAIDESKVTTSLLSKSLLGILNIVRKDLEWVNKGYYRNLWMVLGMTVFGLPLGMIFSLVVLDNIAFMGAFLAIGMPIGMAIGAQMDNKAASKGLQLDF